MDDQSLEQPLEIMEPSNSMNGGLDGCPYHALHNPRLSIAANDELLLPLHKRVISQFSTDADGVTELHLYYDDKEIVFDDPELFGFGETLAKQERFAAGAATTWGNGYDWSRVRELLEQLIDEGVLQHADTTPCDSAVTSAATEDKYQPSPLPPAKGKVPRSWLECEALTRELTRHRVELGYLELIIPIFRIAHIALDADGRQVGEANVFPKPLRLDIPTLWRTCPHPGSRYKSEKPMNVTALKTMRQYWKPMMVVLQRIREAYLTRVPQARHRWTVGDLERLSSSVLAFPAYLLMRSEHRVANGQLHPVLSCIFRVTDGLRMTMHQMMFVPVAEQTLAPDAVITSAEVYDYAERNYGFYSEHGVCAGPKSMVEEFLGVIMDGNAVADADSVELDPSIEEALSDIGTSLDYGFYGLQAHAVVFSLWPAMCDTYEQLTAELQAWPGTLSDAMVLFRRRMKKNVDYLRTKSLLATETWRAGREQAYADMYAQSARALSATPLVAKPLVAKPLVSKPLVAPPMAATLSQCIACQSEQQHVHAEQQLYFLLQQRLGIDTANSTADSAALRRLVACLMNYLCKEQAIVRAATEIQQRINELLGRPAPKFPITASVFNAYNQMEGDVERLPYLVDELEDALRLHIVVTREAVTISEQTA